VISVCVERFFLRLFVGYGSLSKSASMAPNGVCFAIWWPTWRQMDAIASELKIELMLRRVLAPGCCVGRGQTDGDSMSAAAETRSVLLVSDTSRRAVGAAGNPHVVPRFVFSLGSSYMREALSSLRNRCPPHSNAHAFFAASCSH
jgi:hypothetical protein